MAEVSIRLMVEEDVGLISEWTREDGFSITEFDLRVFRASHPQDFFVAEVDGRPVGKLSFLRGHFNVKLMFIQRLTRCLKDV